MENKENAIEFYTSSGVCTVSFTSARHINRISKLYESNRSDFVYFTKNHDGSVCAKIPLSWVRITPPTKRELSESEREVLRQRLADARKH